MKYSVLMSIYKKDNIEWLDEAILSIVNQTILCNQFVIVQDGKIPAKLEGVIEKYQKQYPSIFKIVILEENVGLGEALRIGIKECDYEYIARMDSDDYSVPNRLEKQLEILANNPDIGIVGSNIFEFIDDINRPLTKVSYPEKHFEILKYSKKRCPFRHPAVVFRKSDVLSSGNYRSYHFVEDYDLFLRMLSNGVLAYNIQEVLLYARINEDYYKRRGGMNYFKSILTFKTEYFRSGYLSLREYLFTTIPHLIVILMPNFVRDYFYKIFLREPIND